MKRPKNYTNTAKGVIPHYKYGNVYCPVRIVVVLDDNGRVVAKENKDGLPYPQMMDGVYIYALPGGASISPGWSRG